MRRVAALWKFGSVIFLLFVWYLTFTSLHLKVLTHSEVRRNSFSASSQFLNLRLGSRDGSQSPLSNFLSSCNMSLVTEACSHLSFQRYEVGAAKCGGHCVSGLRNTTRSLLHQVEEMLIFARLAHVHNMPLVFKNWSSYSYPNDGKSFEWMASFFQLEVMFQNLNSTIASGQGDVTMGPCCHT